MHHWGINRLYSLTLHPLITVAIYYTKVPYKNALITITYLILLFVCLVILPVVTIEFDAATAIVNESDGSVTINLVRRTGTLSDNITVYIDIIMVMDSAIIQRMCTISTGYIHK